ncbi:hypothetical protein BLA24064_01967 [Burkholderia latens]|uniref:Uncharacterized protein n=1 Tax=Burkholderia latens TaxID=488446 RepID=A0A6P2JM04_9BURK|nr:hypothetical protein BLA24064_01967 [Burkholderia latens]
MECCSPRGLTPYPTSEFPRDPCSTPLHRRRAPSYLHGAQNRRKPILQFLVFMSSFSLFASPGGMVSCPARKDRARLKEERIHLRKKIVRAAQQREMSAARSTHVACADPYQAAVRLRREGRLRGAIAPSSQIAHGVRKTMGRAHEHISASANPVSQYGRRIAEKATRVESIDERSCEHRPPDRVRPIPCAFCYLGTIDSVIGGVTSGLVGAHIRTPTYSRTAHRNR